MESIDPTTGRPLPADAIQRVLFVANSVHVYNIPPLTSTRGHTAATWTEDPKRHIFTCRIRIIETATPQPAGAQDQVKTDIVLEDASNGQLFAAALTRPRRCRARRRQQSILRLACTGRGGEESYLGHRV